MLLLGQGGSEEAPFNEPVEEPLSEPIPYAEPGPAENPDAPEDPVPSTYPTEVPPARRDRASCSSSGSLFQRGRPEKLNVETNCAHGLDRMENGRFHYARRQIGPKPMFGRQTSFVPDPVE